MYSIWTEFDLNISDKLFNTEKEALDYAAVFWSDHELHNDIDVGWSFKDALHHGLIQFDYNEVNE